MPDSDELLIRALLDEGAIAVPDVLRAKELGAAGGVPLTQALMSLGILSSRTVAITRARTCGYPFVDLGAFEVDLANAGKFPRALAEKHQAFPLFTLDSTTTVAMLDPMNLAAVEQIRRVLACDVDPVVCDAEQLKAVLARAYGPAPAQDDDRRAAAAA